MAALFDDDLWELAESYVDLFSPRRRASPLTDLDKSCFAHDFEILVFCKQFGIHDNETGTKLHRHEYSCLCSLVMT